MNRLIRAASLAVLAACTSGTEPLSPNDGGSELDAGAEDGRVCHGSGPRLLVRLRDRYTDACLEGEVQFLPGRDHNAEEWMPCACEGCVVFPPPGVVGTVSGLVPGYTSQGAPVEIADDCAFEGEKALRMRPQP